MSAPSRSSWLVLEPEADGPAAGAVLVFLPGFLNAAASYRTLLEPVAAAGGTVVVPQLYRRGPAAMTGRFTVRDEAREAVEAVRAVVGDRAPGAVVLGGHSRGGQAAWLTANRIAADPGLGALLRGVVLVDPVDGEGRAPTTPVSTVVGAAFECPALVIGAELGGRCAPAPVNHDVFAVATPHAQHVVVPELGHADMLDGRARSFGRRLCGGAADPDPGRAECGRLVADLVTRAAQDR